MNNKEYKQFKITTICMIIIAFVLLLKTDFSADGEDMKALIMEYNYLIYIASGISLLFAIIIKYNYLQFFGAFFQLISSICLFIFYKNAQEGIAFAMLSIFIIGFIMILNSIKRNKLLVIIEDTEIKDDVEKWIQDVYICWIAYGSLDSELTKIAGLDKNQLNINRYKKGLARDWGIHSKEELLKMVYGLTEESIDTFRKKITIEDIKRLNLTSVESCLAWDMCRAVQILGIGYIADYLTRDEMRMYSIKACKLIQKEFNSWDDLITNYIIGCKNSSKEQHGFEDDRTDKYEYLKNKKLAYQLDWNLNLE